MIRAPVHRASLRHTTTFLAIGMLLVAALWMTCGEEQSFVVPSATSCRMAAKPCGRHEPCHAALSVQAMKTSPTAGVSPSQSRSDFVRKMSLLVAVLVTSFCGKSAKAGLDGVPDVANITRGRKSSVPKIVSGFNSLKAAGAVEDEWLEKVLPKMTKAMLNWGALMRRDVVPDKISRKLEKDAKQFKKTAESKDYDGSLAAFQLFLDDLPETGPGGVACKIDVADPSGMPSRS
eukprot:TRINITY_DN9387_c1_g1_i1.p1 TRINITY_DN9387_c1_g1~~TRINITY_DN9387_c1_g1_i1.p1  ORF type:complete len:233 (+),score=47.83 TRINITY_DN9387_c1_g1_i1:67-765(+)